MALGVLCMTNVSDNLQVTAGDWRSLSSRQPGERVEEWFASLTARAPGASRVSGVKLSLIAVRHVPSLWLLWD